MCQNQGKNRAYPFAHVAMPNGEHFVVGYVQGVRGLKGELRVAPLTDIQERFDPGRVLCLEGECREIIHSRRIGKSLLLTLEGITNRDDAMGVKGKQITLPMDQAIRNSHPTYFFYQLLGLEVFDDLGTRVGRVTEIIQTGANDVYVVHRSDKKDVLLPALINVVQEIDLDRKVMVVKIPEGLDTRQP